MGIKRLGRKRLYAIEKKGILKSIGASSVMSDAIISATQHRQGFKVVTDIVLDLGASAASLKTKALAQDDPIGNGSGASYVCKITDDVFGVVTSVETICLEAGSDGTLTDFDICFAGDGVLDGDASSGNAGSLGTDAQSTTRMKTDILSDLGKNELAVKSSGFTNEEDLKNKFIYITAGNATSQKASATIDCGEADYTKVVSGITRIRLSQHDATFVDVVADDSLDKTATTNGKFGIDGLTSAEDLATSLKNGIGATSDATGTFTATNPTATTVLVTNSAVSATSNNANFLVDDPQNASGITVPSMTGGIDDGQAIASGKLLIRFTGFMVPPDAS